MNASVSQNYLGLEPRRHQRWYEKVLLNTPLAYLLSATLVLLAPFSLAYGRIGWPSDDNQVLTLATLAGTFVLNALLSRALLCYPGGIRLGYQLGAVILSIAVAIVTVVALRLGYARKPLFIGFFLLFIHQLLAWSLTARFRYTKLAIVPGGEITDPPPGRDNVRVFRLESVDDPRRFDALVVDLEARLDDEWKRFIALHNSRHIPVVSSKYLHESLRGSVELDLLGSSDLHILQPNPLYLMCKRGLDIIGTLLLMPLALPLMLLIAALIRMDSPGPALFMQIRLGAGNKPFRMLKFRSMHCQADDQCEARFADQEEDRITGLGRFLRQSRLDELPQLFNVLLGNMSLIGPRPEQSEFAQAFDQEVPFYSYRHIVKPGITGWAQVQHGYACDMEQTRTKVEHDFYYIKNLCFGLDTLIVFKTIRTIFTGFGAR